MNTSLKKQQGLTLISIAFILLLIGFFTLLILKIAPIYMDHSKVVNALAAVENTVDIEHKSKQEIRSMIEKRFNFNYVDNISADDAKISKHGEYVKVELDYEVVEKIAGNLSVLVEFSEMFEVGAE